MVVEHRQLALASCPIALGQVAHASYQQMAGSGVELQGAAPNRGTLCMEGLDQRAGARPFS